jgi:hypothetical protein
MRWTRALECHTDYNAEQSVSRVYMFPFVITNLAGDRPVDCVPKLAETSESGEAEQGDTSYVIESGSGISSPFYHTGRPSLVVILPTNPIEPSPVQRVKRAAVISFFLSFKPPAPSRRYTYSYNIPYPPLPFSNYTLRHLTLFIASSALPIPQPP